MSQKPLAEQNYDDGANAPRSEQVARPKVMRRPANFSSSGTAMPTIHLPTATKADSIEENENLALSVPALPTVIPVYARQWQDDLRFGIAMLTILILVNLALIAWLPRLEHPELATTNTAASDISHVTQATPFGLERDAAPLTVYEKAYEAPAATPDESSTDTEPKMHTLGGADSGSEQ